MKFGCETNLNMQNSMLMITFYHFKLESPFSGKFGSKNKIPYLL